eukprot:CAMPEP_0195300410 /NCGR_PEP_ID=MMETSP0707-20130614/27360_1 /TAXON_ID=33640 /ORGANISM="Asterionellopsis glacialis, Strain CCMP134" /LENGTH=417 /DNA_ID=CAMNT_0040363087 /DNA_START=190 /DNA_END=1443 /DNA_ORIENTATION=-
MTNKLPQWILDYIAFHKDMRTKFPGKRLFTDPNAPNLLVRVCLGLCGGLNDRLGQLPLDLFLANQTKRVYLISWQRPRALENFLIPNDIDWSIPTDVPGWGFDEMKVTRTHTKLFEGMPEDNPGKMEDFWTTGLDRAIERANTGEFSNSKILIHRILGHLNEDWLEMRLKALGETDMLHNTLSYGRIFRAFFQPSPGVQTILTQVQQELSLIPGKYTGVHCRVRHPKARAKGVVVHGKNENYPADKTGLPFIGEDKDYAVGIATHAINCARTLRQNKEEPVYFFADSNDLVDYMVHDLKDSNFLAKNATIVNNSVDQAAIRAVSPVTLIARDVREENPHIDKQKGRDPPAYYPTFVDLYLAMGARCLIYGIGYYAVFASKLSGVDCKLLYTEETWGGSDTKAASAPRCTKETYKSLL